MNYACVVCGKVFERKTPYETAERILCRGCKRVEFYKENPAKNPDTSSAYNCKGYTYKGIHFDSSWELAYYIWLTDHNKQFIYHPKHYMDYMDEGINRVYQPDFLVDILD